MIRIDGMARRSAAKQIAHYEHAHAAEVAARLDATNPALAAEIRRLLERQTPRQKQQPERFT